MTGGRTGRRPGDSGTRDAILAAAREGFGAGGYAGTTIRGVAREACVDPALVHHYFGTKKALFTAALELPVEPTALVAGVLAGGTDGLGERLVRTFLGVWDATPGQGPMLALLRSAVSDERAAASLRTFLSRVVLLPMAEAWGPQDAPTRAALAASQMVGLAMTRYVLRLEPIATASADVLGPTLGAVVQAHLSGRTLAELR